MHVSTIPRRELTLIKEDIHAQGELLSPVSSPVPSCLQCRGQGRTFMIAWKHSSNLWREIDVDMEIEHPVEKQTNKSNKTCNLFGEF